MACRCTPTLRRCSERRTRMNCESGAPGAGGVRWTSRSAGTMASSEAARRPPRLMRRKLIVGVPANRTGRSSGGGKVKGPPVRAALREIGEIGAVRALLRPRPRADRPGGCSSADGPRRCPDHHLQSLTRHWITSFQLLRTDPRMSQGGADGNTRRTACLIARCGATTRRDLAQGLSRRTHGTLTVDALNPRSSMRCAGRFGLGGLSTSCSAARASPTTR
jgi:hypothetical protein